MTPLTLYEHSQLACIVETLSFSLSLMLIGNAKVRQIKWLAVVKWVLALVLFLVGLSTAVQWYFDLRVINPMIDLALNGTLLFLVTFLMSVAFLPLATSTHMTRTRLIFTAMMFVMCIVSVWLGTALDGTLSHIAIVISMAIYLIETVRIIIVFFFNYKLLHDRARAPGSDEEARYNCLHVVVRSIALLSLFAVIYIFLLMLSARFKAFHNFAMLIVWAYLFVSIVNMIISYNPLVKMDIHLVPEQQRQSQAPVFLHPELAPKVGQWIEERAYCRPGVTMVQVADAFSTNRTYLSQYINSRYGCNFNTWLTGLRIDEAKRMMLESPTLPIEQIAAAVGFASKSHFMSSFKSREGVTPGQWRQQRS